MTLAQQCQIEAQEIHRGIGFRCMPFRCNFDHYAGDNTIWLCSTPILRENIQRWLEASQLSSPSSNLMREFAARGYSEYSHATKALHIYKHPCFLQNLNPCPTIQRSASLTTISFGQQNVH
ncbi:uncharacterized protein TNCV_189161 [Trichonephila clavipes]|nr:uncharacterized protein TNCV_189161 [Trichonephila clavipes]